LPHGKAQQPLPLPAGAVRRPAPPAPRPAHTAHPLARGGQGRPQGPLVRGCGPPGYDLTEFPADSPAPNPLQSPVLFTATRLMTRDYAKRTRRPSGARNTRHQPSRKTLPGWLWMVGGVLVGALVMTVADHIRSPAPEESVVEPEPVAVDYDAPMPRFDFNTLLLESEVIVPVEESSTSPPVAMPIPTNPDTENTTAADTRPTEPAAGQLPS